ncbi:MAG TPA: hypothetical protein VEF07_05940 [Candidatus Binataceae bacterium]|nr:hypothetical protein [Candidatus Binataceae bacterium]
MIDTQQDLAVEDLSGCILPSQFADLNKRRPAMEGEYRLLFAVLEDGVSRYLMNMKCETEEQRRIFKETANWFRKGNDGNRGLFAFESVCAFLGIDANRLRKGLALVQPREVPLRKQRRAA